MAGYPQPPDAGDDTGHLWKYVRDLWNEHVKPIEVKIGPKNAHFSGDNKRVIMFNPDANNSPQSGYTTLPQWVPVFGVDSAGNLQWGIPDYSELMLDGSEQEIDVNNLASPDGSSGFISIPNENGYPANLCLELTLNAQTSWDSGAVVSSATIVSTTGSKNLPGGGRYEMKNYDAGPPPSGDPDKSRVKLAMAFRDGPDGSVYVVPSYPGPLIMAYGNVTAYDATKAHHLDMLFAYPV